MLKRTLNCLAQLFGRHTELLKRNELLALAYVQEAEQNVLGRDTLGAQMPGRKLRAP
jgi:hypothetical protein